MKWLLFTLVGPEFILGKAYSEWSSVKKLDPQYKEFADIDGVEWSSAHTFLANMGGFVIRFGQYLDNLEATTSELAKSADNNCAMAQRVLSNGEEDIIYDGREVSNKADRTTKHSLELRTPSVLANRPAAAAQGPDTINGTGELSNLCKPLLVSSITPRTLECGGETLDTDAFVQNSQSASKVRVQTQNMKLARVQSSDDDGICMESLQKPKNPRQENGERAMNNGASKFAQIQEYLSLQSRDPIHGVEAYARVQLADAAAIGNAPLILDHNNVLLVNSALRNVKMNHFQTAWERNRFIGKAEDWYHNLLVLQGDGWVVDAYQLLFARQIGILKELPSLPIDELDDRNKGDALVKGLAMGQVLWLFVQLIARGVGDRTPSQFEIVVLAFSICTLITYILLWNKPQDVRTPICVSAYRRPTMEEVIRFSIKGPTTIKWPRRRPWMPNHSIHYDTTSNKPHIKTGVGSVVGALLFGCLHCAAWNFHFPTTTERLLWRIAAIITAGGPPCGVLVTIISELATKTNKNHLKSIRRRETWIQIVFVGPYLVCRIYITVEIFRSLCFLAPETFLTTWSQNIPHIT